MFGWTIVSKEEMALGQRILKMGMKGRDVRELQAILAKLGFYDGPIDEWFGLRTEEATADLEKALGLQVDGCVGDPMIRLLNRPPSEGGWIVHRRQSGETAKGIAERYGIRVSALGEDHRLPVDIGKTMLVPKKNMWVWADEARSDFACSGVLVNDSRKNADRDGIKPAVHRVVEVGTFLKERKAFKEGLGGWIIDARQENHQKIRQTIDHLLHLKPENQPWVWLSDMMLEVPGAVTFLKLHPGSGLVRIMIELNPPLGDPRKKNRLGYGWMREWRKEPLMFSVNLLPRLDLSGDRRLIGAKEARLWRYRSTEKQSAHIGRYQWAMLPVRDGEEAGRLWFVDSVTMNTLYASLIQEHRGGVLVEGLSENDSRIVRTWRDYFAVENAGHEMTLRDIYLKRENI